MAQENSGANVNAELRSKAGSVVGLMLFAMLAGSVAFCAASRTPNQQATAAKQQPGSTEMLSPFVLAIQDAASTSHGMKVGIGITFEQGTEFPAAKRYEQAIREIVLSRLRTITFEDASKKGTLDGAFTQVLGTLKQASIPAEQIIVTDFVLQ